MDVMVMTGQCLSIMRYIKLSVKKTAARANLETDHFLEHGKGYLPAGKDLEITEDDLAEITPELILAKLSDSLSECGAGCTVFISSKIFWPWLRKTWEISCQT